MPKFTDNDLDQIVHDCKLIEDLVADLKDERGRCRTAYQRGLDKAEYHLRPDAERMRWLLAGDGYFMEEESLCGHGPCSDIEQDAARAKIDEARK